MESDHGGDLFALLTAALIMLMLAAGLFIWRNAHEDDLSEPKSILVRRVREASEHV